MRRLSNEGISEENRAETARRIRTGIVKLSERSVKKGLVAAIRHKDYNWATHMVREHKMSQEEINNAVKSAYVEVRGCNPEPPEICDDIRSIYMSKNNTALKDYLDSFDELVRQIWLKRNCWA